MRCSEWADERWEKRGQEKRLVEETVSRSLATMHPAFTIPLKARSTIFDDIRPLCNCFVSFPGSLLDACSFSCNATREIKHFCQERLIPNWKVKCPEICVMKCIMRCAFFCNYVLFTLTCKGLHSASSKCSKASRLLSITTVRLIIDNV